jgi:hypothetical protein
VTYGGFELAGKRCEHIGTAETLEESEAIALLHERFEAVLLER